MNISAVNQNSGNTNFMAACRVQGVKINGVYYGQRHKQKLYDVSYALSKSLYEKTLSPNVRDAVSKFFADYNKSPYFRIARSVGNIREQKIMLLTASDALEYINLCKIEKDPDVKNWTLNHLFDVNGRKRIILSATKDKNGTMTITGIEKAVPKKFN